MAERAGRLLLSPPGLCVDNGAMIAYAGELLARHGFSHELDMEAIPRGSAMPEDLRQSGQTGCADFS
jgi:N6-L-threonylcarbamoyladenine synthase